MSLTTAGILVDLDALLDVRLALINEINPAAAHQALLSGYHHTREADQWVDVDHQTYRQRLASRTSEILPKARITNCVFLLQHFCKEIMFDPNTIAKHSAIRVLINTYPYELAAEVMEAIRGAISTHLNGIAVVEIAYIRLEDLTPKYLADDFVRMVMYNWNDWMNAQAENFAMYRIPRMPLFAPGVYEERPTDEEIDEVTKTCMHPFKSQEYLARPLVGLNMIDIKHFSIVGELPPA